MKRVFPRAAARLCHPEPGAIDPTLAQHDVVRRADSAFAILPNHKLAESHKSLGHPDALRLSHFPGHVRQVPQRLTVAINEQNNPVAGVTASSSDQPIEHDRWFPAPSFLEAHLLSVERGVSSMTSEKQPSKPWRGRRSGFGR
jgi:hypothetical protein